MFSPGQTPTAFCLPGLITVFLATALLNNFPLTQAAETAYFTSVSNRKILVRQEQLLLPFLYNYTKLLENQISAIHAQLDTYYRSQIFLTAHSSPIEDEHEHDRATALVSNPIETFLLLHRMANLFPLIDDKNQELIKMTQELRMLFRNIRSAAPSPDDGESHLSLRGLLHVIRVFDLNITDLTAGKIKDLETNSGLSPSNCLQLGLAALNNGMFKQAITLLSTGSKLLKGTDSSCTGDCEFLQKSFPKYLDAAISDHDKSWTQTRDKLDHSKIFHQKLSSTENLDSAKTWDLPLYKLDRDRIEESIYTQETFHNHEKLCRDERSQPLLEPSQDHVCFLLHDGHLMNLISPMKVEILHKDPLIFQIYDIVTENQARAVIQSGAASLEEAVVIGNPADEDQNTVKQDLQVTFYRSSQSTWLIDTQPGHPFQFITDRVSRVTPIDLSQFFSAENTQVANYATGGQYIPHPDAFMFPEYMPGASDYDLLAGDRLLTFMIYLNDVPQGGGTAFPFLGVVAKPVGRSGLFWFNVESDISNPDIMTVHGGCPVVYGDKWIANKWVRTYNQMFKIQCPREQHTHEHFYRTLFK